MLFNSVDFLLFFPIITLIYFITPSKIRWIWLLICSVYFYMCWKAKYILLIGFSIVVTWIGSMAMTWIRSHMDDKNRQNKLCKLVLYAVLASNLFILFVFKYYNFFADNITAITGISLPIMRFMLPVGISFYTFQALGYSIDVYRGTIEAEKNPFRYALFVCFFPQLVAGPIERASNLLPQLRKPTHFEFDNFEQGLLTMGWGFFMKVVIADRLAILVDSVYNSIGSYDGAYIILATILFAFQIYCDFNSYSTIARGAAQVLGFKLMLNFNFPFSSKSISEYWERWHISLSQWFQDYIYEPFVWNSKDRNKAVYTGFILVFVISGFWHGASWTYVIWGCIHAVYRVASAALRKPKRKFYKKHKINTKSTLFVRLNTIGTFLLVDFTYIFFRANSVGDAFTAIKQITTNTHISYIFNSGILNLGLDSKDLIVAGIALGVLWIVDYINSKIDFKTKICSLNIAPKYCIYLALMAFILIFGVYGPLYDTAPFIYFQF